MVYAASPDSVLAGASDQRSSASWTESGDVRFGLLAAVVADDRGR